MSVFSETVAPASYVQRAMWAIAQRHRGAPLNVMILPWRVRGPLQIAPLEAAIGDLVARHPTLRTRLSYRAGELVQLIGPPNPITLTVSEVEGENPHARQQAAVKMLRDEGRRPLDVVADAPFRPRLLRFDNADHILCFFVHHAMCDAWSNQVMVRDLAAFYSARIQNGVADLPELTEQYADLAASQIRTYETGGFSDEICYWRAELADLPPAIALPVVAPRKGNRDWRAESPAKVESQELLCALKDLARRQRVSLFSLLLAGVATLLHQRTGAEDMVIGVSTVNRWSPQAMQFVGCATNLLPARIRVTRQEGFDQLVGQVHGTIRRLLAYGRIPLELILREIQSSLATGPVFPVWCQFRESQPAVIIESEKLSLTPFFIERGAILCELEVDLIASGEGLVFEFAHRAALLESRAVAELMHDFSAILRLVTSAPDRRVEFLCQRACAAS